jgi:hypothetical protein
MFAEKSHLPLLKKARNRKSPFVKGDLEDFLLLNHFDETQSHLCELLPDEMCHVV